MNHLYQKTFDQVQMPQERVRQLRTELASRCSHDEKEATMNQTTKIRRPVLVAATVCLIAALSFTALAYGDKIVHKMFTGGTVEQGVDENGIDYSDISIDMEELVSPVEVREDGHLYLIVNGEDLDITGQCSYETPYLYECTDDEGLRHVFVVGGELDAIGWAEFVWDADGVPIGGTAQIGNLDFTDDVPWLNVAKEELNVPW
jgi:hypothetical protein